MLSKKKIIIYIYNGQVQNEDELLRPNICCEDWGNPKKNPMRSDIMLVLVVKS